MTNFLSNRRSARYALEGLAVVAGLLISITCFVVLLAPFWSGL